MAHRSPSPWVRQAGSGRSQRRNVRRIFVRRSLVTTPCSSARGQTLFAAPEGAARSVICRRDRRSRGSIERIAERCHKDMVRRASTEASAPCPCVPDHVLCVPFARLRYTALPRAFDEKVESLIVDSHDGANRIQDPHWNKGASHEWGSLIPTICSNVSLRQSKPVIPARKLLSATTWL